MNNFRHHHPKAFGGRGTDMINPWMTEEELLNMRRQNPQFNSAMQNMPQSMHPAFMNQSNMLPNPNKNFANQNSCKMPNFSRSPNMDVFKSPYMNESNYPNRFVNNRFPPPPPNNAFTPHMNMQHKMNDGPSFPSANMMPSQQSNKNDGFSESISKPLFANTRQPQERFSCMQDDQVQFHSKYDNLRVFQEKGFPFSSDKDFQSSQNPTSMNDPMSVASNMPIYKPNYKAPSLFPAYTPKDVQDDSSKNVQQSAYNSPFMEKSNTFCDKTALPAAFVGKSDNFCDKVSAASATYSTKTLESFQGKSEPFQERSTVERVANDLFSSQGTSSFMYDKQPSKTMPTTTHDSLKTLDNPAPSSNVKYSYPPENQQQQSCYQSDIQNFPSSTSSKDCLMLQSAPFSTQSDVQQQNAKETFSSFNFESSITTTDIADLLPGLDAFLKEHLSEKSEEVPAAKNDVSKSSASNCAFSDDEWSKHSIPFIGDNPTPGESNTLNSNKDPVYDDPGYVKEKCGDKSELKPEKAADLQLPVVNQPKNPPVGDNVPKTITPEKETPKSRSVLEEAIELLVNNDAIVGLDYIIEYKKNIAHAGSIPFRCKLCNSAITRPSIIDHILGSKHRMRYLKTKDESKYDYIVSLKVEKSEKDAKIAEASFELEKIYGRGCVTVDMVEYQKDSCADNSKDTEYGTEEPVFTLDKIPIGFEALSPQHEEMNTDFTLHSNHDVTDQVAGNIKKETSSATSIEEKGNAPSKDVSLSSTVVLPGLESISSFHDTKSDMKSVSPHLNLDNEVSKASNASKDSDTKVQLSDTQLTLPTKRASPSEDASHAKFQKIDTNNETIKKEPEVKSEDSVVDMKKFIFADLEKLSKSPISSDEEASVALQVINVLMEMLLRYKLQHVSLELVEDLAFST